MPENNQASDKTKPEATGSSSTQPGSQAIDMNHTNVIVPHRISNHDKLVQTMVMVDGEWVNVNDTNDQKNVQEDMHKVNRVVTEAQKDIINAQNAADSAVKSADSAISASKVNSDAIAAQSSAIIEAKSAMDSATAEIQQTAANAASDAAKIRADVARVQNEVDTAKTANSASVEALKSDIGTAKQDLANVHDSLTKAQSAVEQNQKLINDSVAKISNDIAQDRKDMATAQQNNADLAKQLDDYSKQAEAQGKTIKSIQNDQNGFTATLADVKGNVSQVSDKVDGLSAGLKDAQGNIDSVKAQADQLNATLSDHSKNIAQLTATAKELSSTLKDADGRLSKVEQTAKEHSSTLSDLQGNLSQVKQTATDLVTTLKDAQGNIDQIKQDAKGTLEQLANVQGDITALQKDVSGIKLTIADHDKNIHTLQADSKSLHDDMKDAQGNISSLQKTATSLDSEFKDHNGRISKVEQTASELINEFSDQQGHLNQVEQTAQGTQQTVANQQGQINTIKNDAAGMHQTITGQGNQIANINVTLSGLNTKYEGVSGDLNNLKSQAQWATVTSAVDLNNVKTPCHEFLKGTVTNAPNEAAWWYLTVEGSESGRITQTVIADQSNNRYTRRWADGWSAWVKDATQTDVTALSNRITTNSTQITQNQQTIALKADQSTVDNLSGEVSQNKAQLQVQADQISSKVSSEDFNTLDNKVNGMKIGTRNLLHNTSDQWRTLTNDSDWLQKTTASSAWTPTDDYHGGDEFTYTAKITNNSHQQAELEVWLFDQNKSWINGQSFHAPIPKGANAYDAHVTFPITASTSYIRSWIIFTGGYAPHGDQIQVKDERLVRGNLAGTWEANPDDTIDSIKKNTTAINQTNKQISLKADQTEVDKVKQTATQNSSRLNVMANEISSKVTSTDVNNIVDGKGYATTSTVQSLITQKAGTINESITNLTNKVNSNNGGGVNLLQGTAKCEFSLNSDGGTQTVQKYDDETNYIQHTSNTPINAMGPWIPLTPEVGQVYTFSADVAGNGYITGDYFRYEGSDSSTLSRVDLTDNWQRISNTFRVNTVDGWHNWIIYANNSTLLKVKHIKIERGSVATPWTPAPSDNATVTQVQSLTASIDGLQSTVANKADKSQVTQLSNLVQSKVSTNDFNNLRKAVDLQTLESADANNLKTNGHYFVHNLANNPVGGWVYVDVTGNGNDRIRQDVYQDSGNKHKYRRWFGNSWTNWSEGATESEITQLRDDINLRVKKGDLLSQINIAAGRTLIQSNKIYFDADSFVMSANSKAFIPSAYITNINADKITAGTLDASKIYVKNFSAGMISGGTLKGIVLKSGSDDRFFQTSANNIYWSRTGEYGDSIIGTDRYLSNGDYQGLVVADNNYVMLANWGGASYENGKFDDNVGLIGWPRIVLDYRGYWNSDAGELAGGHGNTIISSWISKKEYLNVEEHKGVFAHLDETNSDSKFSIQKDNKVGAYFGAGNNGNQINFNLGGDGCGFNVNGPFHVTGAKNSIVETKQGYLAINAYETAEYYFGDIGESNTGSASQTTIGIDRIFNETVNTNIQYQVFVTPYSDAHVWVEKRYNNRFVVRSNKPNAEFGWELKAKRKGYESHRLRRVNVDFDQANIKGEN